METPLLLSLLTSLLIPVAFCGTFLVSRRRNTATNRSIVQPKGKSSLEKGFNRYRKHTKIFIPDILSRCQWPWPRRQINPYYPEVKKEADTWISSFQAFSPKAQDAFDRCNLDLLACLACPQASKEHARAGCDLMHLFFVFDEYSDRSTPSEVHVQKEAILDAFRNPHVPRPKAEWVGGEIARQFWARTIQHATAVSQKRFIRLMDEYLESIFQESIDKRDGRIRDIKSYIDARRCTSGVKPSFSINEFGFDIPDQVMAHPAIQEMVLAAVDMAAFTNDIFSYNMEQLRGDDLHNIITCVMHEHHTDVNGAMLWVEDFLFRAAERFYAAQATLPQWDEPLNSHVKAYCDGLGQWVRGAEDWSFEGERYFGNKGLEVKEKRWMSLLPKKYTTEIGPVHIDGSLLCA